MVAILAQAILAQDHSSKYARASFSGLILLVQHMAFTHDMCIDKLITSFTQLPQLGKMNACSTAFKQLGDDRQRITEIRRAILKTRKAFIARINPRVIAGKDDSLVSTSVTCDTLLRLCHGEIKSVLSYMRNSLVEYQDPLMQDINDTDWMDFDGEALLQVHISIRRQCVAAILKSLGFVVRVKPSDSEPSEVSPEDSESDPEGEPERESTDEEEGEEQAEEWSQEAGESVSKEEDAALAEGLQRSVDQARLEEGDDVCRALVADKLARQSQLVVWKLRGTSGEVKEVLEAIADLDGLQFSQPK